MKALKKNGADDSVKELIQNSIIDRLFYEMSPEYRRQQRVKIALLWALAIAIVFAPIILVHLSLR